jgi:hypothetical protein
MTSPAEYPRLVPIGKKVDIIFVRHDSRPVQMRKANLGKERRGEITALFS